MKLNRTREEWAKFLADCRWFYEADRKMLEDIATLHAEVERLREANGILEDALQEVGDDYPGSSCQEWCQQQVKAARKALGDTHD